MSEPELDSSKIHSIGTDVGTGRSSAVTSWGGSPGPNEESEIPRQLFSSPTHSVPSSSSHLSRSRKKRRKRLTKETSFIIEKETKSNLSIFTQKANSNEVFSASSRLHDFSSSDSENRFSSKKQAGKSSDFSIRSKFKTNKICDVEKIQSPENSQNPSMASEARKENGRRSSVGESSVDANLKKSITSASEISYKERIRDRFNAVKEKAAESLTKIPVHARSQSGFVRRERRKINESLMEEEFELSAAMKRHEEIKMRWRQACEISSEIFKGAEAEKGEGGDFLTEEEREEGEERIFSTPTSPAAGKLISPPQEDKSSTESHPDLKVLSSELLGFNEDWDLVEFVKPEMANLKNEKLWREMLFCPSSKPVPLENKLEPGLNPRFVEEEGLYVGTKMKIPKSLKNKMEQRILMTPEGKKWFGKEGELISSVCPLKPISTRPYFEEGTRDVSMQLVWKPAVMDGYSTRRYLDLSENQNYVLDIDISSIEFGHHPLFSREHVLAQRLKEMYLKYNKRKEMDVLNRLNGRLKALRRTRNNLKNIILEGGDNADLSKELNEYESDIKEVRKMRYVEGQMDKELRNKILATWKDLLKLRERNGYQSTWIKLNVKKKIADCEKEKRIKWESDLKEEINEMVEEAKNDFKKALEEHKEKYEIWRRKRRIQEDGEGTEDSIERSSEEESGDASDLEEEFIEKKPKPPKPVVASEIKAKVTKRFKESFFSPDDPEFEFFMTKEVAPDCLSCNNNKEEMRRAAVKRCMVFVKLFYNGKEVCRSKSHPLSHKFTVKLNQRFAVRISEWPESLMLEIHEETGSLSKNLMVSGIYLPLPDSFATVQNSEIVKHEFSSEISVSYHHTAVGSGNEIIPCPDGSDYNNQALCLYTCGIIACRVGWVNDNGKILSPTEKYWNYKRHEPVMSLSEILLPGGTFDVTKLKEWAEKSRLDPNDPYNSDFFNLLESAGDLDGAKPNHFRLNPQLEEFDFCSKKELENNARFKLLRLRDLKEPEFSEIKMVPLNEKQINKEMFKDYEKRISMKNTLAQVQAADPIAGQRAWGKKYLEQVQHMLLKQSLTSRKNKRYQDIITEESVPDIGTLGLTFMKWLRPKRPLRPVRKERKKIAPQNFSGQEIRIIVNVVRAFEVPVRKETDQSKSAQGSIDGFSLVNVRPFVEISFQGKTARTTAAEGANPTWNQDLHISVNKKNGNFQSVKDTLYIHLFDEIVIDLIEDESARETNIHQRLERHWLASMEIPFSTLYFNSRVEGTFKLYSPPILLGYEREAHRLHFSGSTGEEPLLPQRDATYITLFVTVQPALNPSRLIKEKMDGCESSKLEKHLEGWLQEVTNLFPHRKVKTLVLDMTGKAVCVTRFVRPLPLPPIAEEENMTPEMAARFVAMIPTATESMFSSGFFDIWLSGDQVLRLLLGDSEDHAILLCCYFLRLGLEAYVLLGSGIPHGFTAYVLVKETISKVAKYYVWDPNNGQKYSVLDSFCPLQKVYCVINGENIWANVQAEEMPRRTKFDLSKRADWFPAFGKNISAPAGCVQPESIDYRMTSRQVVDSLQDKIEKKLRDNLMRWRKKRRTQWNRYCAATLRRLLPSLERSTWNSGDKSPDHLLELQHILTSHKICGFPINMPFTKINAVMEAVKATGVHCNETEGVEFALAVYIHPYPNNVLSVWVYVASLIRRR